MAAFRYEELPFIQSRPSAALMILTVAGIAAVSVLPYLPKVSEALGLVSLPMSFFEWLLALMLGYLVLISIVKALYVHRKGSLL